MNNTISGNLVKQLVKGSAVIDVPHKQNRMVIFNSNLLHKTMDPKFRPGYQNRRINLTFLFGERCEGRSADGRRSR